MAGGQGTVVGRGGGLGAWGRDQDFFFLVGLGFRELV